MTSKPRSISTTSSASPWRSRPSSSLLGTVSEKDGAPYIHIHATAGRADGAVIGGHLKRAVISATCELVLHTVYGRVPRFYDERTGLNLMERRLQ